MKRLVICCTLTAAVFCTPSVFADDAPSNPTMSDHQMLKDCIERQKTAGVTQSKAQMKRLCKDELKQQKATGSMPVPPTDAPHN